MLVLESADRVGGRALSETSSLGSRVDLGGQWIGHDHERLRSLALELGLTPYAMTSPRVAGIVDGGRRIRPFTPSVLTAALALGVVSALRIVPGSRVGRQATVGSWLRRVPGHRSRRLLEAAVLISWTADPDQISVRTMFSLIRAQGGLVTMLSTTGGAQDSLLVEGVGTIAEQLADELGERVRLGAKVESIVRDETGATLRTAAGDVRATKVVISAPPPMARHIAHEPPLPEDRASLEAGTFMGSVYKAIAVYERPFWRSHADAEMTILDRPGRAVFDSSPPDGPGHLCILVGGSEARELDQLEPGARRELLLGPIAAVLGDEVLRPASWHEKSWHLDERAGGGYIALPLVDSEVGVPMPSVPVGPIHWAGAETAEDHPGYFDGAIESGQRAAQEVLNALV